MKQGQTQASKILGIILLVWIGAQVAIIRYQSLMKPAVVITGIFVILLTTQLPRYES